MCVSQNQAFAQSIAKDVDLLVTWLFRLTQDYYNYKMAAVLGIMVFIVCAVFTVVCFHFINKKEATFSRAPPPPPPPLRPRSSSRAK